MNAARNIISTNDIELIKADSIVRTVEFHRELPSTNDLALQLATLVELDTPLLVLTEFQTAGRGRGSNQWWSAPGSLTFSLVIDTILVKTLLILSRSSSLWPHIAYFASIRMRNVIRVTGLNSGTGCAFFV